MKRGANMMISVDGVTRLGPRCKQGTIGGRVGKGVTPRPQPCQASTIPLPVVPALFDDKQRQIGPSSITPEQSSYDRTKTLPVSPALPTRKIPRTNQENRIALWVEDQPKKWKQGLFILKTQEGSRNPEAKSGREALE
ncbi:hypothetical protein BHE74_00053478 [Ensete ventricosum]|nr:hypothetical protein BHE74_00053478 [Ensete ventricosum]